MIFSNSSYTKPPSPFHSSYHTPPYSFNYSTCPDAEYHHPFSMNEDVFQVQQQLRFPTPPITPPRIYKNSTADFLYAQLPEDEDEYQNKLKQQRTQSVIMKIGHDQNPQYLPANLSLSYETFAEKTMHTGPVINEQGHDRHHSEQQHMLPNNDTPSSGTSSPSSHNEFMCNWIECGRCFESLELLAHHVTLIHAVASLTDGLYYCRWTGCQRIERGFNARYKMLVHVRTHTKEKPHQCHLCDKRFSRAENLKIHIRSHSGEKPYICTFEGCHKAYSNSSDRFKHTRTHSMEKPYMCKVAGCHKRYTDPSSLRKHVKTFKHSIQIMNFSATSNTREPGATHNSESQFSSNTPSHTFRSCRMFPSDPIGTPTQDSFCMAMEEMCHIKATFNCYSAKEFIPTDRDIYCVQEAKAMEALNYRYPSTHPHSSNYAMQLDLTTEKPLDLTIKRY